jgi:diguanylate cyclase (GGDEF)-like protein
MLPLPSRIREWLAQSIGARIVTLFLGLLLAVQVASFSAISTRLIDHTQSVLPQQLQVGERVLESLLEHQATRLIDGAKLLAADHGFRSAVLSGDVATVTSVLSDHSVRLGAAQAAVLGNDFVLRAASQANAPMNAARRQELRPVMARLAARAATSGTASEIILLSGTPHQLVMVPMRTPAMLGWVMMGFPLDKQFISDMRRLSAQDVTLLTREQGTGWSSAYSGLRLDQAQDLARLSWTDDRLHTAPATARDSSKLGMTQVVLNEEEFGVRTKWLTPAYAVAPGSSALQPNPTQVLAVVSLSIDQAMRPPRELQVALLVITLVGFGIFLVGGLITARRVTTPLRALAAAADRLGRGDFDTPMRGLRRHDEIGHLAQAFERMRVNVAEKQERILQLAYWDSLTGLPNRAQFRDAVREAIERAKEDGHHVAVIMLDLDRFKLVNDVLGYRFGDLLLTCVGERLSKQGVRDADLVARLGGDEFAVLLRRGDVALAQAVAQRIATAFDDPLTLEEHTVDMGAGIGIAMWPQHATDADVLLSRAEVAMYTAKRRTSGPLLYDASFDASSTQTLSLLTELRHAVDHNELRLYLQPKLALDGGMVMGAEALVRWQHPQRGLVAPMHFIPFAEQTGFIRVLTLWVFEEAARHWLALRAEGVTITLSVNLSTRDLLDPELPEKFDALLVKHRVPAEAFCLEITESAIMDDPQRAQATLDRLSALGFKLSIDDFGTGYSSLAYLKRLPVDELKIDKSFVMSMETDADDAKIVRSTIDLAHNLGLTVVAEGVENAKIWDMLRELNCDLAQGYHMGKPMPASEFQKWSAGWVARMRPTGEGSAFVLH